MYVITWSHYFSCAIWKKISTCTGSCNFVSLWKKCTCAYLLHIALEIMWLPIHAKTGEKFTSPWKSTNRIAFRGHTFGKIFSSSQTYYTMGYAKMFLKTTFWNTKKTNRKLHFLFDRPEMSKFKFLSKLMKHQVDYQLLTISLFTINCWIYGLWILSVGQIS